MKIVFKLYIYISVQIFNAFGMTVLCYRLSSFVYQKLVDTNLNNSILGTRTAAIFLSNDQYLYAPITSDESHT